MAAEVAFEVVLWMVSVAGAIFYDLIITSVYLRCRFYQGTVKLVTGRLPRYPMSYDTTLMLFCHLLASCRETVKQSNPHGRA